MRWAFLTALALTCTSCGVFRQVAKTVDDVASILCTSSPDMQRMARAQGVSVEDLCAIADIIRPFRAEAVRAQKAGAVRAGARPVEVEIE
jgi:hypothetical protein